MAVVHAASGLFVDGRNDLLVAESFVHRLVVAVGHKSTAEDGIILITRLIIIDKYEKTVTTV